MNSVVVSKQYRLSQGAAMVKACEESGLQIREWCSQNGVTKDKYYYWKRKLRDICIDSMDVPSFVDISAVRHADTASETGASASVNIDGIKVDIYNPATAAFLQNLLEAAKNV
jgi:hypothetical protein